MLLELVRRQQKIDPWKFRQRRGQGGHPPPGLRNQSQMWQLLQNQKGAASISGYIMEMYPKKEPVAGRFLMKAILGDETATVQVSIWSPLLQKIEPELRARFEESDL